ncbi:hypothetical protein [Hyalangium sp.]|uniref:hypothetical protein n=1 Tax=Hyalangium sp. TaxID=2028555 RepID=UPI002D4C3B0B|nr:hypothetical protein [Hyalangium sp.]HYH99171.1 hypothetical protein [Hyalangium sp.]
MTRVGFGYDDSRGAVDGRRLLIQSKVLKALDPAGGRFLLEEPDGAIFRGDDGGPCFRRRGAGTELAGISVTGLGQESAMISLLPHEHWLREEIARQGRIWDETGN